MAAEFGGGRHILRELYTIVNSIDYENGPWAK